MSYGVKFIVDFLEKRLGKRITKQLLYIILLVFSVERRVIREYLGASDVTLCKYSAALKNENLASIFEQNYNRPQSELEKYRNEIERELELNPQTFALRRSR